MRARIHKIGSMNIKFPQKNATNKQSTKGATNNFSQDIYKIVEIKVLSSGAPMYRVNNINPYSKRAVKGFVDRTAILLISPETEIEGRKLPEHEQFLGEKPESEDEEDKAPLNIALICVTLSTRQPPIGWLNAEASQNMEYIVVTPEVSHAPMSSLNPDFFSKRLLMSVT